MAKERWASRLGLVLAMAGNAVGLGNFLRFPAQAAKNGGGAFLIPYIVALVVVGLPLMWVEWAMGRYGGQKGHHSAPGIFQSMGRSPLWKYFGVLSLWSCLVIASYYLYIESWCLAYAGFSATGGFMGKDLAGVKQFFGELTGESSNQLVAISPWGMSIFAICIIINIYILSRGLAKGIELVAKVGMPLLILFAAVLAVRGLFINRDTDPEAVASSFEGLNYVWQPRYEQLGEASVWLAAAGQIFFTLSIGMGSIHCYASYLRERDDVALTGATTAWTNEFCEVVLGGSILIPIAVAYLGLEQVQDYTKGGSGFGLGFMVFPTLFNKWGWFAPVAGFMWFGLLFFAAITSSLAMGQPIMAFLQQEFGMSRQRSAVAFGLLLLPLSLPVALMHSNIFNDEFDYWAGTVMLVVFALGEAILFAWVFGMDRAWAEMNKGAELWIPRLFYFIIKYVTPIFLILILAAYVFEPKGGWTPQIEGLFGGNPAPKWEWSSGSLVGKLMHVDVASSRQGALDDLEQARKKIEANAKLSSEERARQLAELAQTQQEAGRFYDSLPWWRNIDRLLLAGVFVFFSVLVYFAWSRRQAEGRL
jgi:SNF family Na+-dependent transporter